MNLKQAHTLRVKQVRTLHQQLLAEQPNAADIITNDLTSSELINILIKRSRSDGSDFGNISHMQAASLVQALFVALKGE